MTPASSSLRNLLDEVRRTLRRETTFAVTFAALCAVPGALLIGWVVGLLDLWGRPGAGPLALDLVAFGIAGALAYFGIRRWIDALDERAVAADAERTAGMPEGAVRGALELSRNVPEGTSAALARRAEMEVGRRFTDMAPDAVAVSLRARAYGRRRVATTVFASLSILTVLLGFATPEHSRAAWSPMARPVRNLMPAPFAPLGVHPGDVEVRRGTDLAVLVTAPGREMVTLHWRMRGDIPRAAIGSVIGDSVVVTIPRVAAETEYWVESPDGAVSARYRATPSDPLLLSELMIDVVYPRHVGRATEHIRGEAPPLEVPEGTQLVIRGRATRQLTGVSLIAAGRASGVAFTVADDAFRGTFTPAASGSYAWQLTDAAGGELEVLPAPIDIVVIPDTPPYVDITFPAMDTVLDAAMRQAVVADARDDYGLIDATLVSWRVSGSGERYADIEQPYPLNGDDRALVRSVLDASERGLVPGDTLKFFIRVTDNSPRRQQSVSRTVSLRLPGMVELREQSAERADALFRDAEQLARKGEEIERATRDLERRASAANARRSANRERGRGQGGEDSSQQMKYEEAAAARQLLERQEELVAEMEAMRDRLEAFERAMERAGLRDGELQQRLEEMRQLYEEMLTPEAQQKLDDLRDALESLDPEAVQQALEAMAQQQAEMKEQLDRSVELMRRAAAEQQMNNLAQEARELATQQQALAESMSEQQPTPEQAQQQEELAARTEQLAASLAEMQERLRQQGEAQTAEMTQDAQRTTEQAMDKMQEAAKDAAGQKGEEAAEKGQDAAEQLEQAASALDQARQAMADSWKQDAQQSMQQATQDALALAERQQQLLERMKQADQEQGSQNQPQQMPQPGQQGQKQEQGQQSGQQSGQQQSGQQSGQQGQTGQEGQQGKQQGQQRQGGDAEGQHAGGGTSGSMQSMQEEQAALQQGLQQLGRNLQENAERSSAVNREVSSALARANLTMQQALEQMQDGQVPTEQAQQAVDALNRLALSLLNNSTSMNQGESGEGSESQQQMADIAKKQGNLNGRSNALSPMNITQNAMDRQLDKLSTEQMDIARRLGELNSGGESGLKGDIDAMAREAEDIAQQLRSGGRMSAEAMARQERLFHRMLDAGRTLEKDEYEDERTAERPSRFQSRDVNELDALLFRDSARFRAPTADELQHLPPAYRRLILDYFERLNRAAAAEPRER